MHNVGGITTPERASRLAVSVLTGALTLAIASASHAFYPEQPPGAPDPESLDAALPEPSTPGFSGATCETSEVTVKLPPLDLLSYKIAYTLCVPANNERDTVLLTVHGATYSRAYWDFPFQPDHYSFVRHANNAGYATLNIDRIGVGASSHPLSALLTVENQAYANHQIVSALRSGALGHAFDRVVLVGHSLGSVISIGHAALYDDVDGLVVTGYLHTFGVGLPMAVPNVHPALLDPRFLSMGLDPGYLTTQPNTRGATFYYLGNADPFAIAADEATKETVTAAELAGLATYGSVVISLLLNVPVLSVVGEHDSLFCLALPCGDLLNALMIEPLAYPPQAELESVVVPDAGHDLNLQANAPMTYAPILEWLDRRFPPPGG